MRALCLIGFAILCGLTIRSWPDMDARSANQRDFTFDPPPSIIRASPSYTTASLMGLQDGSASGALVTAETQDQQTATTIWLPANSILVIGSLDATGGTHQVDLQFTQSHSAVPSSDLSNSAAFDVAYVQTALCSNAFAGPSVDGSALSWQPTITRTKVENDRTDDAAYQSGSTEVHSNRLQQVARPDYGNAAAVADTFPVVPSTGAANDSAGLIHIEQRRFSVPFFTSTGVINRYLALHRVVQTNRFAVYADADLPEHTTAAAAVADRLRSGLLELIEQQVAAIDDVDANGRLSIVVSDLTDGLITDEQPILGCVRPSDFDAETPFCGDIVYLDHRIVAEDSLDALLAHELAHAAVFSMNSIGDCPGWLNEAVAHRMEHQIDSESRNLRERIARYRQNPESYPIIWDERTSHRALRRGPARVAGFTFLNTILDCSPNQRLEDQMSELFIASDEPSEAAFAALFRRWSLHLAHHVQQKPLSEPSSVLLRATAFSAWAAEPVGGWVKIQAEPEAKLQISVATAKTENFAARQRPERVSMAGIQPKAGRTVVEIHPQ
ncbi:MAG: hypothetical protein Fues2KO_01650 [Fuerstiella sp.]